MFQPRSSRTGKGHSRRRIFYILVLVFTMFGILVVVAPMYLILENKPVRVDAVIVFSGPDMGAREFEARSLVQEGFARYIMYPHSGILRRFKPGADMNAKPDQIRNVVFDIREDEKGISQDTINEIYEDTHLEVLSAKGMMSRLNLSSAIIVTYPYHLRRVKVIAGSVFPKRAYKLTYMYPRSIRVSCRWWFSKRHDAGWVLGEYAKIAYYLAYTHLPFLFG